jgi:GT2 family glycosyltransferase
MASNTNYTYEVILVDNASTDTVPSNFKEKYPALVLIESSVNQGFGRANNMGMAVAKGKYILLLNSDTEIGNDVLERAINVLREQGADLYSCAQTLADGTTLFNQKNSFDLGHSLKTVWYSLPIFHLARFQKPNPIVEEIIEAQTISGAFMLMKREVYEKTKGFDPDFFLYSEETEWCYNRIR